MSRRYRVQAFLLPVVTHMDHDYAYSPTYFRWRWQAKRWARQLRDSFAPWMVRIELEREQ